MKKFITVLLILLKSYFSFGQDSLDTLFYINPSFDNGIIFMRDGSIQQGNINICNVDQSIRFIESSGDTLLMNDIDNVIKVNINQTTYYRFRGYFTEIIDHNGSIGLCLQRSCVQIENSKNGGYGISSNTSAIDSYNGNPITNLSDKYIDFTSENWKYTIRYVLYDGDKFYVANKKNFIKLFPNKKDIIEEYCNTHSLDTPEKIKELFNILKEEN